MHKDDNQNSITQKETLLLNNNKVNENEDNLILKNQKEMTDYFKKHFAEMGISFIQHTQNDLCLFQIPLRGTNKRVSFGVFACQDSNNNYKYQILCELIDIITDVNEPFGEAFGEVKTLSNLLVDDITNVDELLVKVKSCYHEMVSRLDGMNKNKQEKKSHFKVKEQDEKSHCNVKVGLTEDEKRIMTKEGSIDIYKYKKQQSDDIYEYKKFNQKDNENINNDCIRLENGVNKTH